MLEVLAAERDQGVVDRLVRQVVREADAATFVALLSSRHSAARSTAIAAATAHELSDGELEGALMDRASTVRRAARYTAESRGLDPVSYYLREWREQDDPRALQGALESGARFDIIERRALLNDPRARVRRLAIECVARDGMESAEVDQFFDLLDDSLVASSATRALARSSAWDYSRAAEQWSAADAIKRGRLWRLLSSRSGWDRVRGSLLAARDSDASVSGAGRADISAWLQHGAARMYRSPTREQSADLERDLSAAELPHDVRQAVEFRAGLPITPRPVPQWTPWDAAIAVSLDSTGWAAWRGTTLTRALLRFAAEDLQVPSWGQVMISVGRLVGSGILTARGKSFRMTQQGARLVGSSKGTPAERRNAVLSNLREVTLVNDEWWLPHEDYLEAALPALRHEA